MKTSLITNFPGVTVSDLGSFIIKDGPACNLTLYALISHPVIFPSIPQLFSSMTSK